ncbi:hypothetical protein ACW95P_01760 [Candidatus Mycoplasma pogonae]
MITRTEKYLLDENNKKEYLESISYEDVMGMHYQKFHYFVNGKYSFVVDKRWSIKKSIFYVFYYNFSNDGNLISYGTTTEKVKPCNRLNC